MDRCYKSADILLPDFESTDAKKWAVIACDQFTSEPMYWEEAKRLCDGAPSTLDLILPEVYLEQADELIPKINERMSDYLKNVLISHPDSVIYVERTQSDNEVRHGLVMAVDLEAYDFRRGSNALIRATEATVLERIPPRVKIRRDAPIELPHVMLLIDDREHTVIEPMSASTDSFTLAYETDLMQDGGHIKGYFLSAAARESVFSALDALCTPEAMKARYGDEALAPLLFAVGDGNHSLATAKTIYTELKEKLGDAALMHPARYALVEIVNIHDSAMKFEPIYRVLFGVEPANVIREFEAYISSLDGDKEMQEITFVERVGTFSFNVPHPKKTLPVATVQDFLDLYIQKHPEASVDYIHGEGSVRRLVSKTSVGFLFSGMGKDELFSTVIFDGALPRKTFSMGHAEDKRYYIECRKIQA